MLSEKRIHAQELPTFVQSDAYRQSPILPISYVRAMGQAENPRAQPSDVVLLLLYQQTDLVAYMGAVPDLFFPTADTSEPVRVGWLSCVWVSESARGQGLAMRLLRTMYEAWNGQILATGFTPEAQKLYDKSQLFATLSDQKGFRGYLRPNLAQILAPKHAFFRKMRPLLSLADAFLNIPNALRLWFKRISPPNFMLLPAADVLVAEQLEKFQSAEYFRPDLAHLQWIAKNAWLVPTALADSFTNKYYFSAICEDFKCLNLLVLDAQKSPVGYLMLSVRNKELKVLYAYYDVSQIGLVARLIYAHALQLGANMLTLFEPNLVNYCLQDPQSPFYWRRQMLKTYLISQKLDILRTDTAPLGIQFGDADAAFT